MEAPMLLMFFKLFELLKSNGRNRRQRLLRRAWTRRERIRKRFMLQKRSMYVLCLMTAMNTFVPELAQRRWWMKPRHHDYWDGVLHGGQWAEHDWRDHLRMSRQTFLIICNRLRPSIERQNTRFRIAIPFTERVAITLWKLATVVEYRTMSELFGIGRSTICAIVHETCRAICEILMSSYLKFPTGARLQEIVACYENTWGFPQCAGAIDGMHVPIKAPVDHAGDFFNRNHYHSVVMQGVCDDKCRFIDVFIGFAGRAHDARIFANSTIFTLGENDNLLPNNPRMIGGHNIPLVLIGDPAYPLLPWLMKPFAHRGVLNAAQRRFNKRLSRARMTIENTFGRLKGRWRCLLKKNDFHLENINHIVLACCILHNVCEYHKEPYNRRWDQIVREIENGVPLRMGIQRVNPILNRNDVSTAIRNAYLNHFNHGH